MPPWGLCAGNTGGKSAFYLVNVVDLLNLLRHIELGYTLLRRFNLH